MSQACLRIERRAFCLLAFCACVPGCASNPPRPARPDARIEVIAAERAFAKTMSDRSHGAFATFIAAEAVFFSGPKPLHGKQQIVEWWARYYATPSPPFSWEPEEVEVLGSGSLAISSGPVRDPAGKVIARFTSIWRRTASDAWEVIFDKGSDVCNCQSR